MSENKKLLVVIDPGHTGNTYNAGAVKGYYESKAVYDLSLYEKTALEKRGIDVILTRERNQDPGLYERGQMAVKKGHGYANVVFESNHSKCPLMERHTVSPSSAPPICIIGKTGKQDDRCHCQGHEAIHRHHL